MPIVRAELSLAQVLAPSIAMADGYPIEAQQANNMERRREILEQWESSAKVFLPHLSDDPDVRAAPAAGEVVEAPANPALRPSECAPLFFNAYRLRDAGAVIHSHAMYAMLATLGGGERFECTELEMIKGIAGHGYYDRLVVPIVDNTAHECDLSDRMAEVCFVGGFLMYWASSSTTRCHDTWPRVSRSRLTSP